MGNQVKIMDAAQVDRALARMAHEMIEKNKDLSNVALVGIHTRGVPLSKRLAERIAQFSGRWVDWGSLDITRYRDDFTPVADGPIVQDTNILFPLRGRTVIIVDDVLFTGRTARAAMDAIMDIDRPKSIQLAVLIDRGHRELPIRADYDGKNVPSEYQQKVNVRLLESDQEEGVYLISE